MNDNELIERLVLACNGLAVHGLSIGAVRAAIERIEAQESAVGQDVCEHDLPRTPFGILQQFSVDLNQDGLPRLGEDLRH